MGNTGVELTGGDMTKGKAEWHARMRERANRYANGRCSACQKETTVTTGVIHHLSYPAGVYQRDVEELIEEDICVWLCHPCHDQIHIASTAEDFAQFKRGGYCHYCGRLNFGGWERNKLLGLEHCICRKCFKSMKKRLQQKAAGQLSLFDDL